MESYGRGTVTRLVKIRHFLNLIARGDRVKKGAVIVDDTAKSLPRHPNPAPSSVAPADPPIRPLALNRCSLWIAARKSARKSFDFTDGSSYLMKVFQKT
jgi:hypothetical protein